MSQQGELPHMNKNDEMDQSHSHAWPYELEIVEIKLVDRHYKNEMIHREKKVKCRFISY